MRFKTYLNKEPKHRDLVSCVGWSSCEEVYSAGDDHKLFQWKLTSGEAIKIADLPEDIFPTDLHWFPRVSGGGKKQAGSELLVLTSTAGKFYLMTKLGRIERSVDAHRGAILAGRWSHDGTALATAGEDGQVRIWSRNGMLRSTLASNNVSIYSIAWGPNSDQLLFTLGTNLVIKQLQPNSKPLQWKAHEGLILKVAWNPNSSLIVSGGEDCKYKVWDMYGRLFYTSGAMDYPVTSLSWTPDGELFAVGSFNTLRLCDKTGWTYSLEKPQTQSIFSIAWSSNGTQVTGACGNGQVIFAHVIEKRLDWKNFEATIRGRKTIVVRNVSNDVVESLDFRDNIIKTSLGFGHLVVVTSNQCFIYSTKNWNTPQISELKEGNVSLIMQSEKYFCLVDGGGVYLFSYDGKLISSPKWPGMRPDMLNRLTLALSNDTLAIRDKSDEKIIFLFETLSGKLIGDGKPFQHKAEVLELALDQCGFPNERKLAFIDKNQDLFLTTVRSVPSSGVRTYKLGAMIQSMRWNDNANILATIQEGGKLVIWHYPSVVYADPSLLPRTVSEKRAGEFGKNPQIVSFVGNHIALRRVDGSQISVPVSPFTSILQGYISASQWDDALRLCRFIKEDALWGCLAAMATVSRDLNTAEVAYAALEEVDKVFYIQHIKELPLKELRDAEMALLCRNGREAETILLQAGLPLHAIMLDVYSYSWERALELAVRNKCQVDKVLALREIYLEKFDMKETSKQFLEVSKGVEIDRQNVFPSLNELLEEEKNKVAVKRPRR